MISFPLNLKLKAKNLKCFGVEPQGFDVLEKVNIIIGKNNSGKSSLIDLIEYAVNPSNEKLSNLAHKGTKAEVALTLQLTEDDIKQVFSASISGGYIPGSSHQEYGMKWVKSPLTLLLQGGGFNYEPSSNSLFADIREEIRNEKANLIAKNKHNPFRSFVFKKLSAERDIQPEGQPDTSTPHLSANGSGATQIIQAFLNFRNRKRSLVEEELLTALNKIFNPDSNFERITAQQDEVTKTWEIYLYESKKGGWISLSASGSGLKTVILVLINLILVPNLLNKTMDGFIYAFEELENNLHPALQKRLFAYLYKTSLKHNTCFIFTTHSNVVIDLFVNKENAQLLHVKHDGESASISRVENYGSRTEVLNDLEYRASDLLQSNGIVWVEGPSDRIYFNKWIEILSHGELNEGIDYQCVIYGGALKSHLTANEPDEVGKAIAVLNVNRNAIFLTDSDRETSKGKLKATVKRLRSEFEKWNQSMFLITEGREVENYLPGDAIRRAFGLEKIKDIEKFEKADTYLAYLKKKTGLKSLSKLTLAEKASQHFTQENLGSSFGLKTDIKKVISTIKSWNDRVL